jgi:hypothetical protein
MKVLLVVTWEYMDRPISIKSNIFDWPFAELPNKGDVITITEFIDKYAKFDYPDEEARGAFEENSFEFAYKEFCFSDNETYLELCFMDCE